MNEYVDTFVCYVSLHPEAKNNFDIYSLYSQKYHKRKSQELIVCRFLALTILVTT